MTTGEFLPAEYAVPKKPGKYYKFKLGDNRFRILDSPLRGWVAWRTKEGKKSPLRRVEDTFKPEEFDKAKGSEPKHFWAMPVYDYSEARVKVLEITQTTIQVAIKNLASNKKWGHPSGYDLVVTATGEGMDREYTTIPEPKSEIDMLVQAQWDEVKARGFDINRLLSSGDPFGEDGDAGPPPHDDSDEVPF